MNVIEFISALQVMVTNYPHTASMQIVHEGSRTGPSDRHDGELSVDFIVVNGGKVVACDGSGLLGAELSELRAQSIPDVVVREVRGVDIIADMRDDTSRARMRVDNSDDGED